MSETREVRDTVYLSGYRCDRCGFPVDPAPDGIPEGHFGDPEYRHGGGCGGRWLADDSLQAVILDDGSGPFLVHDCGQHDHPAEPPL